VAFLIARYVAADWVEHRLGQRLQAVKAGVEHEGWRFVAFVRLVPVFPFTLLNYALGLTHLSVRTFALTSLLTMAPGALAYAYLGAAGREVVSGGPALVQKGLLALTLLAAVALLPTLIRHWRRSGWLTPHQVHTLLSQNAPPLVVDVRNPEEFTGVLGHIAGAPPGGRAQAALESNDSRGVSHGARRVGPATALTTSDHCGHALTGGYAPALGTPGPSRGALPLDREWSYRVYDQTFKMRCFSHFERKSFCDFHAYMSSISTMSAS
jgi:hypothetical protein